MILGVGIDLVEVERIQQVIGRRGGRFISKVFTPDEISYCQEAARPAQHFAVRFAAKEAIAKALGLAGPGGIRWREIEVVRLASGEPQARLNGKAQTAANQIRLKKLHLSLSHTRSFAVACAVAEG
jgi:holo-[acyl-carrier protein] synthase